MASSTNANTILRLDLRQLRDRSRDLARNDPYAKNFFRLCRTNIIGKGIQLQVHANPTRNVKKDQKLTSYIETEFYNWAKKETASRSSKLSFLEILQLSVMHLFRDGEILIRFVRDTNNKYGFSLKVYDPDWLDELYTQTLPSGNRVIMGVEVDDFDKPIAYWLAEPATNYPLSRRNQRQRFRVDASEIIHAFFVTESEDQTRGVPALHASMLRLFMHYGFEEAELEQKRVSACQGAYLIPPPDLNVEQFQGDEDDIEVRLDDVEPGMQQVLRPGWDMKVFTPKTDASVEGFRKATLRGVASGAGVAYHTLAGDLEAVNYSSARIGSLDERDVWREYQDFIVQNVCVPVYRKWLDSAFIRGVLDIDVSNLQRIQDPTFRGRGWAWVDPSKDMKAHIDGLTNGVVSLTDVLAEQGKDIEDHFANLKKERDLAESYGVTLPFVASAHATDSPPESI
jgi:lambda family phage portal protein